MREVSRPRIPIAARWLPALALGWAFAAAADGIALEPCHLDHISEAARCGWFEVPEDHAAPDGRKLKLRVAVLPAFKQPPEPDPIFVLAGGPGQSAVKVAALFRRILRIANRERDIVLVDQRGTGESAPLECELDFDALAFDAAAKAAAIDECLGDLDADPRQYTTVNHVKDLEAVRAALGREQINLYGGSYGTRVALVYLREYPGSLRAVVMDSVASMQMRVGLEMGADAQLSLDQVFARCAAEPACAERFPDPAGTLARVMEDLAETTPEVEFDHPATGMPETLVVDHRHLALGLRALLYSPDSQRLLPLLIEQAQAGNFEPFIGLTTAQAEGILEMINPSLLLAVLCAEDLAGTGLDDVPARELDSFVGTAQVSEFLQFCAAWPQPLAPMDWTTPVSDTAPVLFLSGALDPVTPPYRARQAAEGLANARHLEVAGGAHIVGALGCVPDLIAEFFDTADPQSLDASCIDEIAYPSFFVSLLGPKP